jgi:hypothetical protein
MRRTNGLTILITLTEEARDRLRKEVATQNLNNPKEIITPTEMANEIINNYLFRNGKEKEN